MFSILASILFFAFILSTIFCLKESIPSVVEYCIASCPLSSITAIAAAFMPSTGNNSFAGKPPAKEIISGCCVNFSNSLISEPFNCSTLFENCIIFKFLLYFIYYMLKLKKYQYFWDIFSNLLIFLNNIIIYCKLCKSIAIFIRSRYDSNGIKMFLMY